MRGVVPRAAEPGACVPRARRNAHACACAQETKLYSRDATVYLKAQNDGNIVLCASPS